MFFFGNRFELMMAQNTNVFNLTSLNDRLPLSRFPAMFINHSYSFVTL